MTDTPDPDRTREIGRPPAAGPTRQFGIPSAADPTRQIGTPQNSGIAGPNPQPQVRSGQDVPWWQTINQDHRNRGPTPRLAGRPQPPPRRRRSTLPQPAAGTRQSAPPVTSHKPSRRYQYALAFGVVLVMALVAGITIGALAGRHNKLSNKVLDIGKAQQGVAQVLVDPINGYGLSSLGSVSCNGGSNPIVQQGNSFTCDVTVNQEQRHVTVVFQDDQGTYAVDRPR